MPLLLSMTPWLSWLTPYLSCLTPWLSYSLTSSSILVTICLSSLLNLSGPLIDPTSPTLLSLPLPGYRPSCTPWPVTPPPTARTPTPRYSSRWPGVLVHFPSLQDAVAEDWTRYLASLELESRQGEISELMINNAHIR